MAQNNFNHYAKKHSPDTVMDEAVANALGELALQGALPCAVAFEVAQRLQKEPAAIGQAADLLELRLIKCQLGLFGHGPKKDREKPGPPIPPQIQEAIRKGLQDGRLPCKNAWKIAEDFSMHKMQIGTICDIMDIKIGPCQLGAF